MKRLLRRLRPLVPLLGVFAFVASCGSDEDPDEQPSAGRSAAGTSAESGASGTASGPIEGGAAGDATLGGTQSAGGAPLGGAAGASGNDAGGASGSAGASGEDAGGASGSAGAYSGGGGAGGALDDGGAGEVPWWPPAQCGNRTIEPTEQCDLGPVANTGGTGGTSACSNQCTIKTCDDCLASYCQAKITHLECPRFAGTLEEKAQCSEMLACIRATDCTQGGTEKGTRCYCGDAFDLTPGSPRTDWELWCFGVLDERTPNGACRGIIEKVLGTKNRRDIGPRLLDERNPVGYALLEVRCQSEQCTDSCKALPLAGSSGTAGTSSNGGTSSF